MPRLALALLALCLAAGTASAQDKWPVKPIRIWFETGDQDNFYPVTPMADGMHDWVLADERFAKVLADKGYHYQFLFARNAQHVDKATVAQTLPGALEWLWKGYPAQ